MSSTGIPIIIVPSAPQAKILGFQGAEIEFPKGKSIQNSTEYRNFRLRRHLDQSSEISGRSETRGGIFTRNSSDSKTGKFSREKISEIFGFAMLLI